LQGNFLLEIFKNTPNVSYNGSGSQMLNNGLKITTALSATLGTARSVLGENSKHHRKIIIGPTDLRLFSSSIHYSLGRPISLSEPVIIIRSEILLNELANRICLSVDSKSLNLGHVLKEHVSGNLVVRIRSEAILQVVKVES